MPTLTVDKDSLNSIGIKVEISFDGGTSWQTVKAAISNVDDECGIYISEPNLAEIYDQNNSIHPFTIDDHHRLAQTLKRIKGKFLLSINNHRAIRNLYKKFLMLKVKAKYSIARDKGPKARDRTELLIANYPLPKR